MLGNINRILLISFSQVWSVNPVRGGGINLEKEDT